MASTWDAAPARRDEGASIGGAPPARPAQRWEVEPPRWLFHTSCAMFALWLAWIWSRPTFDLADATIPLVALSGGALIWTGRLAATLVRRERPGRWWLVAPAGAAVLLALFHTHAPLRARFALAQDDLGDVARAVLAAPDPVRAAAARGDLGRVGTYRVHGVQSADGIVYFAFDRGVGSMARNGMAYVPSTVTDVPTDVYAQSLQHLRGPWYIWAEHPVSRH
jgi:hypothetical protein